MCLCGSRESLQQGAEGGEWLEWFSICIKSILLDQRCTIRVMDGFKVEVGLHKGLTPSHLFSVVIEGLTFEFRQEYPWKMMTADDMVICGESGEQVVVNLEKWRYSEK